MSTIPSDCFVLIHTPFAALLGFWGTLMDCHGLCKTLTASADNYVVFFLAGLGAYYGATYFISHPDVVKFIRSFFGFTGYQQFAFAFICCFLSGAWLAALEYLIQIFVPKFQISNLAGLPVLVLVILGVGLLSLYVQNNFVTSRIAGALLMPMLQVAALHYYVISDFRQCVPLPVLYVLIPSVLATMVWKHMIPIAAAKPCREPSPIADSRGPDYNTRVAGRPRNVVPESAQASDEPQFDYSSFKWNYTDHPLLQKKDENARL